VGLVGVWRGWSGMIVLQAWAAIFGRPGSVDLRLGDVREASAGMDCTVIRWPNRHVWRIKRVLFAPSKWWLKSSMWACGSRLPWSWHKCFHGDSAERFEQREILVGGILRNLDLCYGSGLHEYMQPFLTLCLTENLLSFSRVVYALTKWWVAVATLKLAMAMEFHLAQ
jgi:hypothetical protein